MRDLFEKRYKELGGKIDLSIRPQRCIRVNTRWISSAELQQRLSARGVTLTPVPFLSDAFFVERSPFNLVSSPEYLLGLFYIQDAASQVAAETFELQGGIVLDAFAAPGGKTSQLACMADYVISIERDPSRFEKWRLNMLRLGHPNCIGYVMDFMDVNTTTFDNILVDAPCSGNYLLEKNWLDKNNLKRINERAQLQKTYLAHALSLLNPGGTLVYSTCSLEPEEDEMVIQHVLDQRDDIFLEKVNSKAGTQGITHAFGIELHPTLARCRRFWPHKTRTGGFFIARLKKR